MGKWWTTKLKLEKLENSKVMLANNSSVGKAEDSFL